MTLKQLKATVEELRAARSNPNAVAVSLESVLKEGLKGNRAVNGDLWSVVMAAARAFPIQLSPGVEKAQAVVQASAELDLAQVWILQAISDGSLITLLQNLRSQPQILTAYDSKAPVRSAAASKELIALIKELQDLITVTPYDLYLQQNAAQKGTSETPLLLVRVQTEEDLPHHGHQHSSSSIGSQQQQQQQLAVPTTPPSGLQGKQESASAPSSSSRSSAGQEAAAAAAASGGGGGVAVGEQQQRRPAAAAAARAGASQRLGKQFLMSAFARKGDSSSASSSSTVRSSSNSPEQLGDTVPDSQSLVRLHLHHLDQPQQQQQQQQLVKAQITITPGPSSSSSGGGSSSSRFLSGRTSAVKGFLHNLQQSASSSIQQSAAAAAGHDITGAVAAAGGAVAAAIGQPFSAVKGFAAAAAASRSDLKGSSSSGKPSSSSKTGSSSSSPRGDVSALPSPAEAPPAAAAAAAAAATSRSSSLHLPRFLQRQQPTAAAAASGGGDGSIAASASTAAAATSNSRVSASSCQVQLKLVVDGNPAADQPVSCVITIVAAEESSTAIKESSVEEGRASVAIQESSAAAGDVSTSSTGHSWGAKSLMQKLATRSHSSKEPKQQQQPQQQTVGDLDPALAAAAAAATVGDVLEGDMWSVMARLRSNSTTKTAAAAAAGPDSLPAAAAAGSQQLERSALDLLQLLLSSCDQLIAAAAASRGCFGDESPELLQFIGLIKQLLNHGLKVSSSSNNSSGGGGGGSGGGVSTIGSASAAALTGWLSPKSITAFGVLQALQHGSKQHPRLMLGADNISNMQAAKALSSAVKLDLWVRSSLNEQLLGVRLSTLLANTAALAQYYLPQALLLQQQQMQEVLQQLVVVSGYKFVLLVEAPAPAAAAAAAAAARGGGDGSSVSAAASGAAVRDLSSGNTSSSSKGSVMDPRRLLGGFSKSFTAFKSGSSSSSTSSTTAAAAAAAAAADQTAVTAQTAATGSSSSSSSIPTFLWAPLGGSSSCNPSDPAAAGAASILKRGQRRLADILEVRVPPPDSAAVLSPENSCALSPVSTPGDAAYAEWWDPNSTWQDLQASGAFGREGSSEHLNLNSNLSVTPDGDQNSGSSERLGSVGLFVGDSGGRGGPAAAAAAAGSSSNAGRVSAEILGLGRSSSNRGLGSGRLSEQPSSEAARKLEEDLSAAMSAPMQVLLDQRRRRGSSSSGGGGVASRGAALHRSSSSGWDAAVAAARARSRSAVGSSVGVPRRVNVHSVNLQRRSRSPEANWPAAGSGISGEGSGQNGVAAAEAQGGAVTSNRVVRHRHKRSSSLNDLPELAALLDSGDVEA